MMIAQKLYEGIALEDETGYEIATARDYFPIVSNRNFINNDFESLVKNGTLEGKGVLKERKYASNPVALESVIRAINRQMSDVADYYGLAIPIRNFNKVDFNTLTLPSFIAGK